MSIAFPHLVTQILPSPVFHVLFYPFGGFFSLGDGPPEDRPRLTGQPFYFHRHLPGGSAPNFGDSFATVLPPLSFLLEPITISPARARLFF